MKNHYIICGFGRIGKIICRELKANQIPMVVIDNGPGVEPAMEHEEIALIRGDATTEDILLEAGSKEPEDWSPSFAQTRTTSSSP